jgi:hypothetical protein
MANETDWTDSYKEDSTFAADIADFVHGVKPRPATEFKMVVSPSKWYSAYKVYPNFEAYLNG